MRADSLKGLFQEADSINTSKTTKALYSIFAHLNHHLFEDSLPLPAMTIQPHGKKAFYGWCTLDPIWETNGKPMYEINISAQHLQRPPADITETVLHEMVHLYCTINDIKDTSRGGSYHNATYKEYAERFGLIVQKHEKYGWTITELSPITKELVEALLAELPEDAFALCRSSMQTVKKKSSVRKYVCPSCGVIIRATKDVSVECLDCSSEFELAK